MSVRTGQRCLTVRLHGLTQPALRSRSTGGAPHERTLERARAGVLWTLAGCRALVTRIVALTLDR
eukprot:scaffold33792_cov146-Isochrysis_galbana.AAC.1